MASFISNNEVSKNSSLIEIRKETNQKKIKDLDSIIHQYEKLSKEQIEKWKFFYN